MGVQTHIFSMIRLPAALFMVSYLGLGWFTQTAAAAAACLRKYSFPWSPILPERQTCVVIHLLSLTFLWIAYCHPSPVWRKAVCGILDSSAICQQQKYQFSPRRDWALKIKAHKGVCVWGGHLNKNACVWRGCFVTPVLCTFEGSAGQRACLTECCWLSPCSSPAAFCRNWPVDQMGVSLPDLAERMCSELGTSLVLDFCLVCGTFWL